MKRRRFRKSTVILLGFTLYSVAVYAKVNAVLAADDGGNWCEGTI